MDKEDFYAAQILETEGWEYLYTSDQGYMIFAKIIGGIVYSAKVGKDS